jgi:hypothetical protein
MAILVMGISHKDHSLLVDPIDDNDFAKTLLQTFPQNIEEMQKVTRATTRASTFREEVERKPSVDLGDPVAAGWTFIINENDPQRDQIIDAINPLTIHRGMDDPSHPMIFNNEPKEEWSNWIAENYFTIEKRNPPRYALIVGGPDEVPFHFQSFLATAASVGRIDFDSIDDLKTYIEKVIRLEKASSTTVSRQVLFFAPDAGWPDPTYYSNAYMAKPLSDHVKTNLGFETQDLMGRMATKNELLQSLKASAPALVYTASHGLGAKNESLEEQKRLNGAICCQRSSNQINETEWLITAEDIPNNPDQPFLEGSIFFQFACFGYGTPSESDFMHWLGRNELNAEADFTAAIPKKLLSHRRGPIGYIGHVDTAWLHGFDDPNSPDSPRIMGEKWHPRIQPFVGALESLLQVNPTGMAMGDMGRQYNFLNARLTDAFDLLKRGKIRNTSQFQAGLSDTFIYRTDAQNYMIFGDPAARLRIPRRD